MMDIYQQFLDEQNRKIQERLRQRQQAAAVMPQPVYPSLPVVPVMPQGTLGAASIDRDALREGLNQNRDALRDRLNDRPSGGTTTRPPNEGTTTRPPAPSRSGGGGTSTRPPSEGTTTRPPAAPVYYDPGSNDSLRQQIRDHEAQLEQVPWQDATDSGPSPQDQRTQQAPRPRPEARGITTGPVALPDLAVGPVATRSDRFALKSNTFDTGGAGGGPVVEPEQPEESWAVWQLPDGSKVAAPSSWGDGMPEGSNKLGDDITDPVQIQRAKDSPFSYDNSPVTVQQQITPPAPVDTSSLPDGSINLPPSSSVSGHTYLEDIYPQLSREDLQQLRADLAVRRQQQREGGPLDPKDVGSGAGLGANIRSIPKAANGFDAPWVYEDGSSKSQGPGQFPEGQGPKTLTQQGVYEAEGPDGVIRAYPINWEPADAAIYKLPKPPSGWRWVTDTPDTPPYLVPKGDPVPEGGVGLHGRGPMPEYKTQEEQIAFLLTPLTGPQKAYQQYVIEAAIKANNGEPRSFWENVLLGMGIAQGQVEDMVDDGGLIKTPIGVAANMSPVDVAEWVHDHPEEAQEAYDEGGWEAVWELYQSDANIGQRIVRDVTTDPWTLTGVTGKVLRGIGGTDDVARFARFIGEGLEQGEKIGGSLGADYLIEGAARNIRNIPGLRNLLELSNPSAREQAEGAFRDFASELRQSTPSGVAFERGGLPATTPNRPSISPADGYRHVIDNVTGDIYEIAESETPMRVARGAAGTETYDPLTHERYDVPAGTTPVGNVRTHPGVIPEPDLSDAAFRADRDYFRYDTSGKEVGRSKFSDLGSFQTERKKGSLSPTGQTGERTRSTPIRASSTDPTPPRVTVDPDAPSTTPRGPVLAGPVSTTRTPVTTFSAPDPAHQVDIPGKGSLDFTDVPARFRQPFIDLATSNDLGNVQSLIDDMRIDGVFAQQVSNQASISRGFPALRTGGGIARPAHPAAALETSELAREVRDRMLTIDPNATLPPFARSTGTDLGPSYLHMERAIHEDWATSAPDRQLLKDSGYILDEIPTRGSLTPEERQAIDNNLRMIEEHVAWHPAAATDPDVIAARDNAIKVRDAAAKLPDAPPGTVPHGTPAPVHRPGFTRPDGTPLTPAELAHPRNQALRSGAVDEAAANAFEQVARDAGWTADHQNLMYEGMRRIKRQAGQQVFTTGDLATGPGRDNLRMLDTWARLTHDIDEASKSLSSLNGRKLRLKQDAILRLKNHLSRVESHLRMNNLPARPLAGPAPDSVFGEIGHLTARQKLYRDGVNRLTSLRITPVDPARNPMGQGVRLINGGIHLEGIDISPDVTSEMMKHVFDNGETVIDRTARLIEDARGDPAAWIDGDPGKVLDTVLKRVEEDYRDLLLRLFPDKGRHLPLITEFGIITRLWRDAILANWLTGYTRYVGTQYIGNMFMAILAGPDYFLSLAKRSLTEQKKVRTALRDLEKVTGKRPLREKSELMESTRFTRAAGMSDSRSVFDLQTGEFGGRKTELGNFFESHNFKKVPLGLKAVLGDDRVYYEGLVADTINRDSVFSKTWRRQLKTDVADFTANARNRLANEGFSDTEIDRIMQNFRNGLEDGEFGFSAKEVRTYFRDYLPETMSDRLGRDWQAANNARRKLADAEVGRITFGGTGRTKLDDFLSNFIMFHYFQSRQFYFMTRQALKHPALLNFYINSQEELNRYMEEHPDMPPWLKGMIHAGNYFGVGLYVNPVALLQVGLIYGEQPFDFEGETKTWLQEKMGTKIPGTNISADSVVFLNPVFTNALNLFGYTGDDFDVNILNLNQWGRTGALLVNYLKAKGWINRDTFGEGLVGNPLADIQNRARDFLSSLGFKGSLPVEYVASENRETRELNALIIDEAIKAGMDPENPEDAAKIEDAKSDPTSDLYVRAMKRYLWGEAASTLARSVPVLGSFQPRTRLLDHNGQDLMLNQGGALTTQLRNRTDPDSSKLYTQTQGYYELGNTGDKTVDAVYTMLVYDTLDDDVTVELDGVTYTAKEINSWDEKKRKTFATAVLVDTGTLERWQGQKDRQADYLADPANAEYAQYKAWQGGVRQYEGGPEAYWQDLAANNPNAQRYLDGLDPDLSPSEREKALTSTFAMMAAKGVQPSYDDPQPLDTNSWDPLGILNMPAKPIVNAPYVSDYNQSLIEEVQSYEQYRRDAEPVIDQIMLDMGIDPDTPLNALDYRTIKEIKDRYKDQTGYSFPEPSGKVYGFVQWQVAMRNADPDADISLDAYIAWSNEQYLKGLPESFNKGDQQDQDREDSGKDSAELAYEYYNSDRTLDEGFRLEDQPFFKDKFPEDAP